MSRASAGDRRREALLLAAVLAAIGLVFGRALLFESTSLDEQALVFQNPIHEHFGWREIAEAFDPRVPRVAYGLQYLPLSDISHALDRRLFGSDPRLHHAQNLMLHGAAASALFLLVTRLGATSATAAVAGAIFGLHMLQAESVAWISGRTTVLSGTLVLWALVTWHAWCVRRSTAAAIATVLLVTLANLAKQSAIVAFALLAVVEWTAVRLGQAAPRHWAESVRTYVAPIAVCAGFMAIGIWVGRREGVIHPYELGPGAQLRLSLLAIAWYARQLVWPFGLVPSYDFETPASWLDPYVIAGMAVVVGWLGIVLWARRHAPLAAAGLVLAALAILPGVNGVGRHVVAARYAYVMVAGAAIAAAVACERLGRRAPRVAAVVVGAVTLMLGAAAYAQVGAWRNDLTLFGDAAVKEPARPLWHHMLGRALVDAGRGEEGKEELATARALNDGRAVDGYCAVAAVLAEMGRQREQAGDYAGAEEAFASALEHARSDEVDRAAVELGAFHLRRNEREKARAAYAEAVAREPEASRLSRYRLTWLEGLAASGASQPEPSPRATLPARTGLGDNAAKLSETPTS